MEQILAIIGWISAHYMVVISAVVGILTGLIAIFLLIPGDQPEKFLQSIVDFLKGISNK